ncbi:putative TetR-family transcriptional regulator [metagenome]|uniref:Putative TetR-family transcriptional regulator n=1 Tax=metagenome TaxID=256318 RepID=A0A2P2C170_9ZZZZ
MDQTRKGQDELSTSKAKSPTSAAKVRRPRDSLSRELIIEAAERVAHRDGLDRLTFQAIGKELEAHPTSVYRHFRDKDELVLELIDTLRGRSYGGTFQETDSWRDDLRTVSRVIHDHYLKYPEFALEMASRTTRRPTEFATVEFALGALKRAGLSPADAAVYLRAFGNMTRAMSAMEASMHALPQETRRADDLAWQVEYRSLPAEDYPHLAEVRDELTSISDPRAFDTALEMMLDAIALRVGQDT